MPTNHTVKQGEYLSLIAEQYGFHSYKKLWDDPANADLKQKRKDPNLLLPGDQVVVPDAQTRNESRPAGARHKFVAPGEKLTLRLVLKDDAGEPVANADCRLSADGDDQTLTTDAQGKVERPIPRTAQAGRVTIQKADPPIDLTVAIGSLDPIDTVTGQIARLNNLGYDAGPVQDPTAAAGSGAGSSGGDDNSNDNSNSDGSGDEASGTGDGTGDDTGDDTGDGTGNGSGSDPQADAKMQFRSAVEEFQCDNGLTVDGVCGPQTQDKLKQVHGC